MTKAACIILGENYELLRKSSPNSRMKVNVLSLALLVPTMMWAATGYLLASEIKGFGIKESIGFAVFMMFLVFILESLIVRTPKNKTIKWLRLSLGFLMALIGSIILDEWLFKEDIDKQMAFNKMEHIKNETSKIIEESQIEIIRMEEEVRLRKQEWDAALDNATREADGTGGSGNKGVSAITKMKMQVAGQKQLEYEKAAKQLTDLKESVGTRIDERIGEIESLLNIKSLLTRMHAMFSLIFNNAIMFFVWLLITGILFCLEFIVVILKMSWEDTPYEKYKQTLDEIQVRRMNMLGRVDELHPGRGLTLYQNTSNFLKQLNHSRILN